MLCIYIFVNISTVKEAKNLNLDNIVTPIDADKLEEFLIISGYDEQKKNFLIHGFKEGFSPEYEGPLVKCKRTAPNLKLRVGSKIELWNKVMNEVELGRYAGPFNEPPFE